MANYAGELNTPVLMDGSCTFSIMTKHFYVLNEVLHKCLKIPADDMIIHT